MINLKELNFKNEKQDEQMKQRIYRSTPISRTQSGKLWRLMQIAAILVIIPILVIDCTGNSPSITQPEPYFPVQKEVQTTMMLVLLPGKLVIDNNGYIRVDMINESDPLIIWPYGYSLQIEGKDIWIINDKGQVIAKVGDAVELGGGFVGADIVEERTGQALPKDAAGPYFISNSQ